MSRRNYWLPLFIGLRYTFGYQKRGMARLITSMSTAGIVLGVAMLILIMSVMNGFDSALREKILAIVPHIKLVGKEPFSKHSDIRQQLQEHKQVQLVTTYAESYGLLRHRGRIEPILLYGINLDSQTEMPKQLRQLLGESLLRNLSEHPNSIALGELIANRLSAKVGDKLSFMVPSAETNRPALRAFRISSLLHTGTEIDNKIALTSVDNVLRFHNPSSMNTGTRAGFRLFVDDLFESGRIARELYRQLPAATDFNWFTWEQSQGNLYRAIQMSRIIVVLLVVLILAIASFNLLSSLMITSAEKKADIAILKTLGIDRWQLLGIFSCQGFSIGLLGTLIGTLSGCLAALWITDTVAWLQQQLGFSFISSEVYPVDYLPSDLQWQQVATVAIITPLLTTAAALYPAWIAMKSVPAAILRYE